MDVVFFDASVLFKAAVSRFLLGAAVEGEFRAVWSSAVVEETRRNLSEAGRTFALAALEQNLEYVRDALVERGSQWVGRSLGSTDEKDRHVLAAAISARATVLVTNNAKHFDRAAAGRRGVAIATPDEFATSLAKRNPHALVRRVERTPPERLERYVALLRAELPAAMEIVEPLLGK